MATGSVEFDKSGNFNLVYNFFTTLDYTLQESNSSYALPFTPFYFKPNIDKNGVTGILSNRRIKWDFGDGTQSEALTGEHAYDKPGMYKVTCFLYDKAGEAYFDTYSTQVRVRDFIEDRLVVCDGECNIFSQQAGQLTYPINIKRYNSYRSVESNIPTIVNYISGSTGIETYYGTSLETNPYGHLPQSTSFYNYLTTNSVVDIVPTNTVTTTDTNIYIKLSGTDIIYTDKTDSDAFFAGVSGAGDVYYNSDLPGQYNLYFGFEVDSIIPYTNTTTYGIIANITTPPYDIFTGSSLVITSNGIDGEGQSNNIFYINKNKFSGTKVGFVVRVKDNSDFTQKYMPQLSSVSAPITLTLTDGTTVYPATFYSTNYTLSNYNIGGFLKGYFTINTNTVLNDVYITASTTYNNYTIVGTSNTFDIYPNNYYNIAKKGEDIDFKQTFKSIAFQPVLINSKILFDDFLGSIFGDITSAQTSMGKSTYEKIKNFADNNSIIDYANVDQLVSLLESIDFKTITRYTFPSSIKRLVDILSISHSRLFGQRNINAQNFNTYGYLNSDIYGINLGNSITTSYSITAGNDIIAFEKYSGNYLRLNTFSPLCASTAPTLYTGTYRLSDYNSTWGWPLVYNNVADLFNYYEFYEFVPTPEGTINNSVINFYDDNNTISSALSSYTEWSKDDGTISNILANALYQGLDLIS